MAKYNESARIYHKAAFARLYHGGGVGETPEEIPPIPDGYGCFLQYDHCGGRELLIVPNSEFEFDQDGIAYCVDQEFFSQGVLANTYSKGWCISAGFATGKNMNSLAWIVDEIRVRDKNPIVYDKWHKGPKRHLATSIL